MTAPPMRLHYALLSMADAVDAAAAAGRQETAWRHLDDARTYAAAWIPGKPPETARAIGRLLAAASPARYRTEGFSLHLRDALSVHATAVLTALDGDLPAAVQANADASDAAGFLPKLHAAFGQVRNEICALARDNEICALARDTEVTA